MSEAVRFLFGVHNHQPSGNFESVILDAVRDAYHPFLAAVRAVPGVVLTVHCSGGLLAFLRERARPTFDLLGRLAADGRVELLTGGFYEPILAMLPDGDKVGRSIGHVTVSPYDSLAQSVRDKNMLVGVMAVPASAAQPVANDLIEAGVKIIFNYSEALLDVPPDVQLHTSNPAVELLTALYFHLM